MIAGRPESVQDALAAEARRRFQCARRPAPADIVVAGNHPWPGDPMQSFKVLLHHRAACRPGGVLVGLFWTDPGGDRPLVPRRRPAARSPRPGPSAPGPSATWSRPPSTPPRWPARRPRS